MAAGNFADARAQFAKAGGQRGTVSLYFIPQAPVSGQRLDVTTTQVGGGAGPSATTSVQQTADDWVYYRVGLSFAQPGTWQIEATAGPNKGCFLVTLP